MRNPLGIKLYKFLRMWAKLIYLKEGKLETIYKKRKKEGHAKVLHKLNSQPRQWLKSIKTSPNFYKWNDNQLLYLKNCKVNYIFSLEYNSKA